MIIINEKKFGFKVRRVWYWNYNTKLDNDVQLLRLLRINCLDAEKVDKPNIQERVDTLTSNLTEDEEKLFMRMNKNYRYEIRRAEKEDFFVHMYCAKELRKEEDIISEFEKIYFEFADQLNSGIVLKAYDRKKIDSYIDNDCILLTKAQKEKSLVFHLYVLDSNIATLCYSASDFRDENVDKAMVGRMNKFLHWKDMKYLKGLGIETYDWGNVSTCVEEKYNGIDKFKAGFGGTPTQVVNMFVGSGIVGNLYIKYLKKQK